MAISSFSPVPLFDIKTLAEHARVAVSRGYGTGRGIVGDDIFRADVSIADWKTAGIDMVQHLQEMLYKQLVIGAAEKCPECLNCPHLSIKLDSHPDHISGVTKHQAAIYCRLNSPICPDGRSKFNRQPKIDENPNSAPGFPTNFGAPYTKTASADVPTTASGTAW